MMLPTFHAVHIWAAIEDINSAGSGVARVTVQKYRIADVLSVKITDDRNIYQYRIYVGPMHALCSEQT